MLLLLLLLLLMLLLLLLIMIMIMITILIVIIQLLAMNPVGLRRNMSAQKDVIVPLAFYYTEHSGQLIDCAVQPPQSTRAHTCHLSSSSLLLRTQRLVANCI